MARPNLFTDELEEQKPEAGFSGRWAPLGKAAGARRLGASVWELDPGQTLVPYHYHRGDEEMLVVLRGRPTLRTPDGERELAEGEVVSFRRGPTGAHQVTNRSPEPARYLMVSTDPPMDIVAYPDSGKVGVVSLPQEGDEGEDLVRYRFYPEDPVDYFEGEQAPS